MEIKGILFDKDGTLIKFKEIWVRITNEIIDELLAFRGEKNNMLLKQELAASIGLHGDDVNEKGFLASGTTRDIADQFNQVLSEETPGVFKWLEERFRAKTEENKNCILPTCDLHKALSTFKENGIKMGVATSDDYIQTKFCLEQIGIDSFIEFIGAGDRYKKKPDPEVVNVFCEQFNIQPKEVVVVGDTICDMKLGANSNLGCAVGVLSGVGSKEALSELATFVVSDIEAMIKEDGNFIWS